MFLSRQLWSCSTSHRGRTCSTSSRAARGRAAPPGSYPHWELEQAVSSISSPWHWVWPNSCEPCRWPIKSCAMREQPGCCGLVFACFSRGALRIVRQKWNLPHSAASSFRARSITSSTRKWLCLLPCLPATVHRPTRLCLPPDGIAWVAVRSLRNHREPDCGDSGGGCGIVDPRAVQIRRGYSLRGPRVTIGLAEGLRRNEDRTSRSLDGIPFHPLPAIPFASFQPHGGTAAEDHRPGVFLDRCADYVAQSAVGRIEAENQGDGQPLYQPWHCRLEKYFSRVDYRRGDGARS